MNHSFNTNVAEKFGMYIAILLENLYFWIEKNMANEKHFYDGRYWTYNTRKAFSKLFPYMTSRQVEYYFKKMEKVGLIVIGNYNKNSWDRTCWYALTDKSFEILGVDKRKFSPPEMLTEKSKEMAKQCISPNSEMAERCIPPNGEIDFTISLNRFHEIVEPIPYTITDINTNKEKIYIKKENPKKNKAKGKVKTNNSDKFIPPTIEEVKTYCEQRKSKINPQEFYNHYMANGWMVGKNKMKNWKYAIMKWEMLDKRIRNENVETDNKETSYDIEQYESMDIVGYWEKLQERNKGSSWMAAKF